MHVCPVCNNQTNYNPYRQAGSVAAYPQYSIPPVPYPSYNPWYVYHGGQVNWPVQNGYYSEFRRSFGGWDLPDWEIPIPQIPVPSCGFTGYKTNKPDRQAAVAQGGWHVAWADDISESDLGLGIVSAGVSVVSSNPGPFLAWITELTNRTITSLQGSAQQAFTPEIRRETESLAADIIKKAVQGRSAREITREFERVHVKAGAIEYNGGNYLCSNLVTPTWGLKPYIAVRIAGTDPGGLIFW